MSYRILMIISTVLVVGAFLMAGVSLYCIVMSVVHMKNPELYVIYLLMSGLYTLGSLVVSMGSGWVYVIYCLEKPDQE